MMDRVRSLLDDPEFMSRLPNWFVEDLNSIRDDQPRSLNISMSDWKDKRVPIELRLVAFIVFEQMSTQIDCLTNAINCFIKNCNENGEIDVESIVTAINAAVQIGMLNEETSQILKHSPDYIKANSAREHQDRTLQPLNDRRKAEADEFWEEWRRLYRQRLDLFGDKTAAARAYVESCMMVRGVFNPKTGRPSFSETILRRQLSRRPSVDWMPNRLH